MNAGSIQHASVSEATRPVTVTNPPGALRVIGMRLLLLAISLFIGLGFIEIALRIVGAKPKPPQYGERFGLYFEA